ncbi:MAG: hypothetical protein ACYDH9_16210 [Limisphaerales bacterium]
MIEPVIPRDPSDKEIFFEAIDLPTAQARAAFLERVCGSDLSRHQRLEELLAGYFDPGAFMEAPAASASREPATESTEGPTIIGRYKLLEKIGEGGCGVVYVAEQTQPVRRRVALKVIKLGMDTKAVVARFEAERQAMAMNGPSQHRQSVRRRHHGDRASLFCHGTGPRHFHH